jgi:S-(hydroxymethyl)glutathione dehydrogenase/alcohol dehydrogenase
MKARAAILVELKKPLVLDEIEIPQLRAGHILVRLERSGLCGSQIGEINGVKGQDEYLPHLLGHEGAGWVQECGEGVTFVKPGDHVVLHWRPGAGMQGPPPRYQSKRFERVNAGSVTTFNEYAVISENRATPIPDDFDPEIGALMGCAVTTGLGVINNNSHVKIGESVVVWGAGGVGLSIVQGAAMVSAGQIIAVDLFESKLSLARDLGATHTVNSRETNAFDEIRQILGTSGADVVIDNTGSVEVIQQCYELTKPKGKTILVGVPPHNEQTSLHTLPLHFGKTLTGSHGGESHPEVDIPRYVKLFLMGKLKLKPLLTAHYPFEKINDAIADIQAGKIVGRCMIHFEGTAS